MLRICTSTGSVWHVDIAHKTFIRVTRGSESPNTLRGDGNITRYNDYKIQTEFAGRYMMFICDSPTIPGATRMVTSGHIIDIDFIPNRHHGPSQPLLQANNPSHLHPYEEIEYDQLWRKLVQRIS
jgi:hypothetical protein